ncbi:uncharacterized protein MONOS_4942 [Monocercomonoides exilis]|uniref:uncharacterized protein n=1 Tax=Monocercomonoides exilis TaxID=2049356 RepID=UPI0035596F56|nr:hypothetical protein MONOS_4942 [Monocercomonoides exilis]|eukprot:MONOS_4942.1-p1 / transcript=MONOS_4942.1 / gene=MONOS_4942 / organism=Monocercomonoides_exilis_PA203 / gene_product=unspecified product / transcript_product=unspecified product / location=Mono_scaffold00138:80039-80764(-) / protein_length=198 / sequence_SO=supercontig / SO=protein_coding / is_pseudo=false
MKETDNTKKFTELFSELEDCTEIEQKQKFEEMIGIVSEMDEEEFDYVFTKELYDEMYKMIEEKKISLKDLVLMLKHVGYYRMVKRIMCSHFCGSKLVKSFEKMIVDENEKKEEKDENLLVEFCESYLMLYHYHSQKSLLVCVPCLLKVALKKEENEEVQKEVEFSLNSLSNICTKAANWKKTVFEWDQRNHNTYPKA